MKKIDLLCIVDDDPISVFTTKHALSVGHFCDSIIVFKDGKEAFDKLRAIITAGETLPEVILLDLNMPVWDGWQFLDEFTQVPIEKDLLIYIISSSNDPEDLRKAEQYKFVSKFIVKPVTVEKLQEVLSGDIDAMQHSSAV